MVDVPNSDSLVSAYQNPFEDQVLGSALKTLDDTGKKQRNALGTQAFSSGAFGDARHGVESAALTKDLSEVAADLTSRVKSEGFDKSMGWLNTDLDRQLNTSLSNAALENQWFGNQLDALQLGEQFNQNAITNSMSFADALLRMDQYDRDISQQGLNVDYEDWLAEQNWDENRLNNLLATIQGIPGQTGTTSSSTSPNNSWATILGGLASNDKFTSSANNFLFGS